MRKTYIMFSRKNDVNGNPFRLLLTFVDGTQKEAFLSRSSSPNIRGQLERLGYEPILSTISLLPAEFKRLVKQYNPIHEN